MMLRFIKKCKDKAWLLSAIMIMFSTFCNTLIAQSEKTIDRIVAVVGNEIILMSDVETGFESQRTMMAQMGVSKSEGRCLIIEDILYQKLLLNQARWDSLEVSDDQVEGELDRRIRYFTAQIGTEEKLEEYYGKTINEIKTDFRDVIKEQMLTQMMQGKLTEKIKISPAEVKQYYTNIPQDSLPYINSEIEVAHIVKKPKVTEEEKNRIKETLNGLRERVLNGEDFGTLAYLYSNDPGSAKKNGELGFVERGDLVPEFEAVAFNLKKDEVSEIVETKFGFHILKLIERRGEKMNIRHILLIPQVSQEDLNAAKEYLDSIAGVLAKDSVSFEIGAGRYSDDVESRAAGGKIINPQTGTSIFESSQLDPTLFFAIDKLNEEEISAPVLMNDADGKQAYRLVKLLKRTDPHAANLKDDYQRIQNAALSAKQSKSVDEWIKKKQQNTYIRITDEFKSCTFVSKWLN